MALILPAFGGPAKRLAVQPAVFVGCLSGARISRRGIRRLRRSLRIGRRFIGRNGGAKIHFDRRERPFSSCGSREMAIDIP